MAVMAQNGLGMVKNEGLALKYMTQPLRVVTPWLSMGWGLCTWKANVWVVTRSRP